MFTDDPLQAGVTTITGAHVTQMRTAANAVNALAGLLQQSWTDPSIVAGVTNVQAVHLLELRNSLTSAFGILGLAAPSFMNVIAPGAVIRAADIQELCNAVH
jgi:hypothetical protein